MSDFLSDEQQAERIRRLWKEYGPSAIIGLVLAISAVIGWHYYQDYSDNKAERGADLFAEFEATRGLGGDVDAALQKIEEEFPKSSYHMFSQIYLAKDAADAKDWESALSYLDTALDLSDDRTISDMIRVRKARVEIQLDQLDRALATLSEVGEGFRTYTLELTGDIHRLQGNVDLALTAYETLLDADATGIASNRVRMKISSLPRTSTSKPVSNET